MTTNKQYKEAKIARDASIGEDRVAKTQVYNKFRDANFLKRGFYWLTFRGRNG